MLFRKLTILIKEIEKIISFDIFGTRYKNLWMFAKLAILEKKNISRIAPNPADMLAAMAKFNLPQQQILGDESSDDEAYGA